MGPERSTIGMPGQRTAFAATVCKYNIRELIWMNKLIVKYVSAKNYIHPSLDE